MSFFRHPEIYRSDVFNWSGNGVPAAPGLIVCDEFPAGYSSANCSPAGSASASPTVDHFALKSSCRSMAFHRTANSVLTVCLSSGGHPIGIAKDLAKWNTTEALSFLKGAEDLKSDWIFAAGQPAAAYLACTNLVVHTFAGLLPKRLETEADIRTLAALIEIIPSYGERAELWADACMRASLCERQDVAESLAKGYLIPALDRIPAADKKYWQSVLVSTAPALYRVGQNACFERLKALDSDQRDAALYEIIRFLLHGKVPSDPQDQSAFPERGVSFEVLLDIVELTKRLNTDWMIYAVVEEAAEMFHATRKQYVVNIPQREDVARRFIEIANERLPIPRQIRHEGFKVITLAQALRMRQSKQPEWDELIQRGRAIENTADKAFVLETIAVCLPGGMSTLRGSLLAEATELVGEIRSELDQIERYVGFADDIRTLDSKRARDLLDRAAAALGQQKNVPSAQRRRLVDVAFRVDEDLAATLIDKFDDDASKKAERAHLRLLRLRGNVDDAEPENAVPQIGGNDIPRFGWLLLRALNSRRMQDYRPHALRRYLELASRQPLRRAFPLILWYIENAVSRFARTDQAATFVRPMLEATHRGAEMAGLIAGSSMIRLKAVKLKSSSVSAARSVIIRPKSTEEAIQAVSEWCAKNLGDFVRVADPFFSPAEIEWLQVIRTAKPACEITVLTGRSKQPSPRADEELADIYERAWRDRFDQAPPRARIAILGGEIDRGSPIHDRWIVTESAGLRVGTSVNAIGGTKVSEISEMPPEDAEEKLAEIDQYLNREKTEHNGERLRLSMFWL